MSQKNIKECRRTIIKNRTKVAKDVIIELMQAPFRYRFIFCMKILFKRIKF